MYASTVFIISRALNGENKTNKLPLCIFRLGFKTGWSEHYRQDCNFKMYITAYWFTNKEIADLKQFMSPFLEVSRSQEQTKLKTILFLLFLFRRGGVGLL